MPIRLHLALSFLLQGAAFFAGGFGGFFLVPASLREQVGTAKIVPLGIGAFGAMFTARYFMRKIPVRCPNCGGKAYATREIKPLSYLCTNCHQVRQTRWRSNV
jgi:hypothetical protein